ncbi:MAG: hypothetical protein AB1758_05440 [Candidatus Eremiobacterota bacterium]
MKPLTTVTGDPRFSRPLPAGQKRESVHSADPVLPQDKAHIQGDQPVTETPTERPEKTTPPEGKAAPPPVPVTLSDQPVATASGDEAFWVLDSARGTALADHPALEVVRQKLPQIGGEAIRGEIAFPLLDALTTPDVARAGAKLDDIARILEFAGKRKKEARQALESGGWEALVQLRAEHDRAAAEKAASDPDAILEATGASVFKMGDRQKVEAVHLMEQYQAGNPSPGLGTSGLAGTGISYLRGRNGARVFFTLVGGEPRWLAICDKSQEQRVIDQYQ